MNPALAFARSRDLPRAALICLVIALATTAFAGSQVDFPDFRYLVDFGVPVAAIAPVAYAIVLGTTLFTPMADLELTAAQPMHRHRALHLTGLALLAVLLTALPLPAGLPFPVFVTAARNAVGYLGLAMISGRLFGSGLAWLLPLGTFGPTLLLGVGRDSTPEWWAWSLPPATDPGAAVIAALLWTAGLLLAATASPRKTERAEAA
ncbi:hypothetical protein [Streptomyces sp. NPDC003077]|uniref:hypothetical protein n=1 Tax=Streptomyces sp. NPDC003077 TaxID=3154443 RepID=UPI0033B95CF5